MDYERFKEGFQDALKAELAVRGADVELTARRVDKMNESYDAITVRPTDSSIGVNISIEKAFASYENGTPIPEIAEHFADAVEKGFRESPQVDLESLSDYSFAYVATWSQGKEMPELKESLNTIREAAADLITKIDAKVQELTAEKEPISFYVAECGEFHSMGEFHENLTLQQAVDIYKSISSDRMNGVKTIGFVIKDENLLANEYDIVVGNRLNMQEMKDILPDLAVHPLVVKAADEITKLLPELNRTEKVAIKDAEKEESVSKKIKEKAETARPKKAKTSKKKEEVAI